MRQGQEGGRGARTRTPTADLRGALHDISSVRVVTRPSPPATSRATMRSTQIPHPTTATSSSTTVTTIHWLRGATPPQGSRDNLPTKPANQPPNQPNQPTQPTNQPTTANQPTTNQPTSQPIQSTHQPPQPTPRQAGNAAPAKKTHRARRKQLRLRDQRHHARVQAVLQLRVEGKLGEVLLLLLRRTSAVLPTTQGSKVAAAATTRRQRVRHVRFDARSSVKFVLGSDGQKGAQELIRTTTRPPRHLPACASRCRARPTARGRLRRGGTAG